MTLHDAIAEAQTLLARSGLQCADPKLHAKQIASHVLGLSATEVLLRDGRELSVLEETRMKRFVAERATGTPFQYLAGHEWFWETPFEVGPGVLIPRPETEIIVERLLLRKGPRKVAELGAGSGNIGISVLRSRPDWQWHGFEKNPESVKYLRSNVIGLLGSHSNYRIKEGDFFKGLGAESPYDLLVANPPYVVTNEIEGLSKEVRSEPKLALDGGDDGLTIVRQFFEIAELALCSGGAALSEVGMGQAATIADWLAGRGWKNIVLSRDLAGIERVVEADRG